MDRLKFNYNERGEYVVERTAHAKWIRISRPAMLMIAAICFMIVAWGEVFPMILVLAFATVSMYLYREDIRTFFISDVFYFSPVSKKIYINSQDILTFDDVSFIEHISISHEDDPDTYELNLHIHKKKILNIEEDGYKDETTKVADELSRLLNKKVVYKKK
jgi:hypothetical protein